VTRSNTQLLQAHEALLAKMMRVTDLKRQVRAAVSAVLDEARQLSAAVSKRKGRKMRR
jgi:hypothetical protein